MGGGRAYYLDTCGRLGRRDERARKALRYTPRSLVSAPAVHHRVSRWRRPAAGWGSRSLILCVAGQTEERTLEVVTIGKKMRGVKIIPAQIYTGVDTSHETFAFGAVFALFSLNKKSYLRKTKSYARNACYVRGKRIYSMGREHE